MKEGFEPLNIKELRGKEGYCGEPGAKQYRF